VVENADARRRRQPDGAKHGAVYCGGAGSSRTGSHAATELRALIAGIFTMIDDPAPTSVAVSETVVDPRSPSWGAILAGLAAGLAIHFLLMLAGTALGLGIAQPATIPWRASAWGPRSCGR
jgi:hypothetical protein